MAHSKQRDPSEPTFYLDHSTLCDAFLSIPVGARKQSAPCYAPLLQWIQRVASEANLCLSAFHIAELGRWGDVDAANAMARWYEGLPIVWMHSNMTLDILEFEHAIKTVLGLKVEPVEPFAPSFLASFHRLTPEMTSEMLAMPEPIVALLHASRKIGQEARVAQMQAAPQMFRDNRAWADARGWTDTRKDAESRAGLHRALRHYTQRATETLRARGDAELLEHAKGVDVEALIIELYESSGSSLPHFRVTTHFTAGLVEFSMRRDRPSKSENRATSGTFHDFVHVAAGAAYCDVFTCDREVSRWLGNVRGDLGLTPPLSAGRHGSREEGFVRDLMARWPRS